MQPYAPQYGLPPPGAGVPPPMQAPQGGSYGMPPPMQAPQGGGYGMPPPQGGGYGMPPPQGGGYGMPPPQGGGYGMPPPQGGGYGMQMQQNPYGAPYGAPAAPYGATPYGGYAAAPNFVTPMDHPPLAPKPFHQGGQHVLGRDRCPFYHKMGACRHFDSCTKVHEKPSTSRTVILPMMYPNPKITPFYVFKHGRETIGEFDKKWVKKYVEDFYEDVFMLLMEYGRIVEMRVVDNLCEHMLGNVYVKFENEVAAQNVVDGLTGKMYNGILLLPDLCPVHDFPDATCKEADEGTCKRAIQCNYWHPTPYPKPGCSLLRDLSRAQDAYWKKKDKPRDPAPAPSGRDRSPRRSRSRSPRRGGSPPRQTYRRERSPEDARLCHICGRTGHISKDCPLKD